MFANELEMDIKSIINKKIINNINKYPIDKAYNKKEKYTELWGFEVQDEK